jgi:hypothetical protein
MQGLAAILRDARKGALLRMRSEGRKRSPDERSDIRVWLPHIAELMRATALLRRPRCSDQSHNGRETAIGRRIESGST